MNIESTSWRRYEREIHKELSDVFRDCDFEFNDSIFGQHSKVDRQIDIAIRGQIGGNKVLGAIDCKHFSKKIDVKIVESFLGMIDDVKANFGIIITNRGYSPAAINRAKSSSLKLEILEFTELSKVKITFNWLLNQKINNLNLSRHEFFKRCQQNWGYFDIDKSNYRERAVVFKEGHANTEYYAFKNILKASAKMFRDFIELDEITVKIPAQKQDESTALKKEKRIYSATISRIELQDFLDLNFEYLRQDIESWRENFVRNPRYTKETILSFAKNHITSVPYTNHEQDIR